MAVPKKKTSKSKGRMRAAHHAVKAPNLSTCSNCQEPIMPHRVCPKCGWYDGREVVSVEE
ncbi:50S ribosomal protein L32 [Magnetococcus sp. PR-3]|uniref:50S ribosomal protein L32 n=1 Tax=Magnetococcus sp. PR-3 TaxID=3120355 RepID=UPI002FCE4068